MITTDWPKLHCLAMLSVQFLFFSSFFVCTHHFIICVPPKSMYVCVFASLNICIVNNLALILQQVAKNAEVQ